MIKDKKHYHNLIDDNTIIKVEEIVLPNGEIDLYLKLVPNESSGKKKMTINELAKIVQEGFIQVNVRLDRVEQRLDRVEQRLDRVEQRLDEHSKILAEHSKILAEHSDIFKRNNLK